MLKQFLRALYLILYSEHHRGIMLNHTTYQKTRGICKVHNVPIRYIINKIYRTRAARVKGLPENKCFFTGSNLGLPRHGLFSFHRRFADPSGNILGSNCVPVGLFIHIFLFFSSYLFLFSFLIYDSVCCNTDMHINYINMF